MTNKQTKNKTLKIKLKEKKENFNIKEEAHKLYMKFFKISLSLIGLCFLIALLLVTANTIGLSNAYAYGLLLQGASVGFGIILAKIILYIFKVIKE